MMRAAWLLALALMALMSGCNGVITADTEKAWQSLFAPALVSGYTNLRGLDYSADAGVAVFRYDLPSTIDPAAVASLLRRQIEKAQGCYTPVRETAYEVQMRCPLQVYSVAGFQESRALVDPKTRRVTVMAGGFDSRNEIEDYEGYAEVLYYQAGR
jgi:hypothetical protein